MRVQLSMLPKWHHTLPGRDFEHNLISNFKLKGLTPLVSIALLSIMCSLHAIPNLENLLRSLVNDLWSGKLCFSKPSADNTGRSDNLLTVKCFDRLQSFNASVNKLLLYENSTKVLKSNCVPNALCKDCKTLEVKWLSRSDVDWTPYYHVLPYYSLHEQLFGSIFLFGDKSMLSSPPLSILVYRALGPIIKRVSDVLP
ncbi:hypothetical protein Tco_0798908 [Tanacetum coccineum]